MFCLSLTNECNRRLQHIIRKVATLVGLYIKVPSTNILFKSNKSHEMLQSTKEG
jgi:hypothetical protein